MIQSETKYYTYKYTDPITNNPIYIGYSGELGRWEFHLNEAKKIIRHKKSNVWIRENCVNSLKTFTILKILRAGAEPIIDRMLENVTKEEAIDEEIRLIAFYGRKDKGFGTLTNLTDGGDGCKNGVLEDIKGQKFGRLLVIKYIEHDKYGHPKWLCRCECGNEKVISSNSLTSMRSKSCGCLNKDLLSERQRIHGMSKTYIYKTWKNIRQRCYNPNDSCYRTHGGKGIGICGRWSDFENFYKDVGERPSNRHKLIRINKEGHFNPNNCTWLKTK